MERQEPIFADGLRVYSPHENAPDFVIGSISIEKGVFMAWLNSQPKEKINLDIKRSRKGVYYAQVNTYEPKVREQVESMNNSDVPF